MKLLGSLLVVLTGIGCGMCRCLRLYRRAAILRSFERLCAGLAARMRYTDRPTGDLLDEWAADGETAPLRELWQAFQKAPDWRSGFDEGLRALESRGLSPSDVRLLEGFSRGLGTTDRAGQIAHCRDYAARLKTRADAASEQVRVRGRLYLTLGTAGGLLAVLIL
jgi:stage III sporulation protein AB